MNYNDNTVSVIDAATCNAEDNAGCSQTPPTVAVGNGPVALAVNDLTDTVYVANWGNGAGTTLSVIDGATCNAENTSGCSQTPSAVTIGTGPAGVTVDPATDTVYAGTVAQDQAETVWVVNGATCNASTTAGCGQTPLSVATGTGSLNWNVGFQLDRVTSTLYVTNYTDNDLSMMDVATCNAIVTFGCSRTPPVADVGSGPSQLAFVSATQTLYTANTNDNTLSALDAATCNALVAFGCSISTTRSLITGMQPKDVTYDPASSTLYVPNGNSNTLSLLDAEDCSAVVDFGCSVFPPTVPVGVSPTAVAFDTVTHTAYVTNDSSGTVSVLDTSACGRSSWAPCGLSVATVTVGQPCRGRRR